MAAKRKKVLIIIPAYNEGKNIGPLLEKLERKDISDICDIFSSLRTKSREKSSQYLIQRPLSVVHFNRNYACYF